MESKSRTENFNPNVASPGLKASSISPSIRKSTAKTQNSAPKSHRFSPVPVQKSGSKNSVATPSPQKKIKHRKFVVVKKNSKREVVDCKCNNGGGGEKCVCVAYESLRTSQDGFFKNHVDAIEEMNKGARDEHKVFDEMCETTGPNSGRVLNLVKAFEKLLSPAKSDFADEIDEKTVAEDNRGRMKMAFSFSPPDFPLTSESLGLDSNCSSLNNSQPSVLRTSSGDRRNQRKSSESGASTRRHSKRIQHRNTPHEPFKLRTEERGKCKEEKFFSKVKQMTEEEEKLRIPIAQGLPWTTDEPECLVKPPVRESTRIVDVVLHSDIRAMERAEFDHQVAEKLNFIEQYKAERERQQKLAEEEEIRRLRKELVPKAQPMPYFDRPFIPQRPERHSTTPKEPKIHKKIKS